MSKKYKDIILSAIFMLFGIGIAAYAYTYRASRPPYGYDLGDWWLPFWCAAFIAFFSVILLLKAVFNKDPEYCKIVPIAAAEKNSLIKGLLTVVLLFVYVVAFRPIGFLISSIVYLFLQLLIFSSRKNRNWKAIVGVSIGLPAIVYVVFVYVFNYILPAGILG